MQNRKDLYSGERCPNIFLSYSRADLRFVSALASALRHQNIETWLDLENLKPGEKWKSAIEGAISKADLFLFCASDHSLESSWANVEVQKAVSFNVPLLCVAVSKCDLSSLPPQLKELQAIEVWRFPAGSILKSTVKEIEAVLALRYLITPKSRSVTQKGVSYVVHSPSMNDVGLDDLFVDLTKPDKNIEIIKWPEPEHIMEWLLETSALNGDIVLRLGPKEELFEEFILGSIVSGLGSRLLKIEDYSEGRTRSNLLQLDLIVDFQSRL